MATDLRPSSLEEKLEKIGITWYHYKLLLILSLAQLSDAAEILGISFVLPDSSGMAVDLDKGGNGGNYSGHVSAALFAGMMVGGYLFGTISDTLGRRRILICSMFLNFVSGLASAFSNGWLTMTIARFISGVGAGAAIPISFTYFIEFFGSSSREQWVIYLGNCWAFGAVFVSVVGYLVLPLERHFKNFPRWRLFLFLIALPDLLTSLLLLFVCDDSPKFLLEKKKMNKLTHLLAKMEGEKIDFVDEDIRRFSATLINGDTEEESSLLEKNKIKSSGLQDSVGNLKTMFSKQYIRSTIGLALLWFSWAYAYYGWYTFQPTYAENEIGQGIYFESMLGAAAQLFGTLMTILLIGKLDAGSCIAVASLLSSATMFTFEIVGLYDGIGECVYYILWVIFSVVSNVIAQALNIVQGESYKTQLRGTAFGFHSMLGRIGAVAGTETFGMFSSGRLSYIPVLICATLFVITAISAKIPEAKRGEAIC